MIDQDLTLLYSLARYHLPSHLRSKLDPGDLVQETMLRVHRSGRRFDDRSPGERISYLRSTLKTTLADFVRWFDRSKRSATRELPLSAEDADGQGLLDLPGDGTSPSQRALINEHVHRLEAAIQELPTGQRQAVLLHHIRGCSLVETAEAMNISKQAAAGLLRRGLQALRYRLRNLA